MKIAVIDVAAESGGALTILKEFHEFARHQTEHEWTFSVSTPSLDSSVNVEICSFPWVKRSWLHRLFYEAVVAPAHIRRKKPDLVLSLQNVIVRASRVRQAVYVHQPIPFVDQEFDLRRDPKLWFYKNILSRLIYSSIRRADSVVVQTRWMRDAVVSRTGIDPDKVVISAPAIETGGIERYVDNSSFRRRFFYPAEPTSYKNHAVILNACRILETKGVRDYEIILTVPEDVIEKMTAEQHPRIKAVGRLERDHVLRLYGESVLLFPSKIETFGLPLLEARAADTIVIASDMPFGREILEGYPNARFFDADDASELARLMHEVITGVIPHVVSTSEFQGAGGDWQDLLGALTSPARGRAASEKRAGSSPPPHGRRRSRKVN